MDSKLQDSNFRLSQLFQGDMKRTRTHEIDYNENISININKKSKDRYELGGTPLVRMALSKVMGQ